MSSYEAPYAHLAPYYEELSETRDWDAWIAFVQAVLQECFGTRSLRLLDAACGTGRIAVGLMSLGHRVTGVDVSRAMLQQAEENARTRGFLLPLMQQDLRHLHLPAQFDAAVCLCDSLNYITDYEEFILALRNIAGSLEPQGLFLFDVNTAWKLEHFYGDYIYAEHRDGFSYIWENEYDPSLRMVCMRLTFFIRRQDMLYERVDEVHVQRAYSHDEVTSALQKAGFELVSYGEVLGLRPPEPERERVFYLARRR